jgi:hypothetical protein
VSRWIGGALMVAVAIVTGGCNLLAPDGESNCGAERTDLFQPDPPFTVPNPQTAAISNGQAIFGWRRELRGLCSQGSHGATRVSFEVETDSGEPDPGGELRMDGRVYHAAFMAPYSVNLHPPSSLPDANEFWRGELEAGLKQGNPDGSPATITVEVVIAFNSSGNIDVDRVNAAKKVERIKVTTVYHEPKETM